jgi:hypothetical protein
MPIDHIWLLSRPAATDVVDSQSQVIGIPSYLGATGGPPATRYYFIEISRVGAHLLCDLLSNSGF